jgi:Protein of unknown function (DUF3644)
MASKKTRTRRVGSVRRELILKSRESALSAVQVFNNPLIEFKSETFIVLMVIAWTYLLHAYYRSTKVDYRYYEKSGGRKKYDRTKRGSYKFWDLERCLNDKACPLDRDTANNLKFLIGLRHEIEHQMAISLDNYLSGRYQACSLNYNLYIRKLFGERYALDRQLAYSIQFLELAFSQVTEPIKEGQLSPNVRSYIATFDEGLSQEEFDSERYSYRLIFTRKLAGKPGQADKVVEFIDPDSDLAKTIAKEYWVTKEVERPKFLPSEVTRQMQVLGFKQFSINRHADLWKSLNAKADGKGYGTLIGNTWYWYERWRDVVKEHCEDAGDRYR